MNFYVYQLRVDGDIDPFYVGKGMGGRAYVHLDGNEGNNLHKNNKIKKALREGKQIKVEFLWEGLEENEAFRREIWAIHLYGRRDNGTGPLTNATDGGEGSAGCVWSEESRKKFSALRSGVKCRPEAVAKRAAAIKSAFDENPELLVKRNAAIKAAYTEERKVVISEQSRDRWLDDSFKRRVSEKLKENWKNTREERMTRVYHPSSEEAASKAKLNPNLTVYKVCTNCGKGFKGPSFYMHVKFCK